MTKNYFIADPHFGHKPMLHLGDGRPFDNVEEMNETQINNWNAKVGKGDNVYICGDFIWNTEDPEPILKRLNGNKFLIMGNHDRITRQNFEAYNKHLVWIKDYFMLKIKNGKNVASTKIVLSHYPFEVWDSQHYGSYHFYGHVHKECGHRKMIDVPRRYNVGVDVNNFEPVSLEEIVTKLKEQNLYDVDVYAENCGFDKKKIAP